MLSAFATELIVEILLYLPYQEFLRAIRLNSRLWSIAHHPKSPLRHRLRGRTSSIYLCLNNSGKIYLEVSIDETIPGDTNTRYIERQLEYDCSKVGITDENYVESEKDRNIILMEKSRIQSAYKTDDGLDGTNNSYESYKYDQFSPDLSMRLAVCNMLYVAEYLTINKKFTLGIHNGRLLNKFLLHFDTYDIRLAPISININSEIIDLSRLYESKFFQQKIYELSFSFGCKAIRNGLDFHHYETHRNKLREVKSFGKYVNIPIKHTDDDLLLLDNIESLTLYGESEITGNGIAKLVKKVYENKQGREINIGIWTKQKFAIEEVLKYVPGCKITKVTKEKADIKNMFDEVFKIECLDRMECPDRVEYTCFKLNSHDL